MLYIFTILVIFLCAIMPKDKLITMVTLFHTWVLFAFNSGNPDRIVYYSAYYNNGDSFSSELLFKWFSSAFYNLGFSYDIFKGWIALIYVFFMYQGLKRITENINFVLGGHIILILWLNITQIRSGVAMMIVLAGCTYLIDSKGKDDKKNTVLFFIHLIVATLFHSSAILFGIFVLAKYLNRKKCIVISILGFGVLFFTNSFLFISLISIAGRVINARKLITWVSRPIALGNIKYTVVYVSLFICMAVFMELVSKYILSNEIRKNILISDDYMLFSIENDKVKTQVLSFCLNCVILSFIYTPMMLRHLEWMRLFRLDVMFFLIVLSLLIKPNLGKISLALPLGSFLLFGFFYVMAFKTTSSSVPYFNVVFRKVFESNYFIEWLMNINDTIW